MHLGLGTLTKMHKGGIDLGLDILLWVLACLTPLLEKILSLDGKSRKLGVLDEFMSSSLRAEGYGMGLTPWLGKPTNFSIYPY